jgi:hypothetical protein
MNRFRVQCGTPKHLGVQEGQMQRHNLLDQGERITSIAVIPNEVRNLWNRQKEV